jgi:hypothetical protein
MEDLPKFDVSNLQKYKFKMYSQKYHHWAPNCITIVKGVETTVDVYMLADTLESSSHKVSNMSVAISTLVKILIVFTLFEYLMLFMHNNEALNKKSLDRVVYFRRIFALVIYVICVIMLFSMLEESGNEILHYVA